MIRPDCHHPSSLRRVAVEVFLARSASTFRSASLSALAQALHETHRRAGKSELGAELIFEEALEAEMKRGLLVGENKERGRRGFRLRDVVDAHRAGFWS